MQKDFDNRARFGEELWTRPIRGSKGTLATTIPDEYLCPSKNYYYEDIFLVHGSVLAYEIAYRRRVTWQRSSQRDVEGGTSVPSSQWTSMMYIEGWQLDHRRVCMI